MSLVPIIGDCDIKTSGLIYYYIFHVSDIIIILQTGLCDNEWKTNFIFRYKRKQFNYIALQ